MSSIKHLHKDIPEHKDITQSKKTSNEATTSRKTKSHQQWSWIIILTSLHYRYTTRILVFSESYV